MRVKVLCESCAVPWKCDCRWTKQSNYKFRCYLSTHCSRRPRLSRASEAIALSSTPDRSRISKIVYFRLHCHGVKFLFKSSSTKVSSSVIVNYGVSGVAKDDKRLRMLNCTLSCILN